MKNASVSDQTQQETLADVIGQQREIDRAVLLGLTPFYTQARPSDRQRLVGVPHLVTEAVAKAMEQFLPKRMIIPHQEVERWQKYYLDQHGITTSFGGMEIPLAMPGHRLVVMHADVSNCSQRVADVYRRRCDDKWWQFTDNLDMAVPKHSRSGTYGLWVPDVVEAPDGFENEKNLSSQDTWDRGWVTTTLPERLIDGDMVLLERKVHLDHEKITLCAGSRNASGSVPSVSFDRGYGRVKVDYWRPSSADDSLRFRRAIV